MLQKSFDLGAKNNSVVCLAVMQRLFPDAIPSEKQRIFFAIPDCEGKHAIEFVQAAGSAFFVQVHDNFGVRSRSKAMSLIFEFISELLVIVNLTIERNPYGLIFVGHGLFSRWGKIDDAQPFMSKTRGYRAGVLNQFTFIVRSAVGKRATHGAQHVGVNLAVSADVSVNAAHVVQKFSVG